MTSPFASVAGIVQAWTKYDIVFGWSEAQGINAILDFAAIFVFFVFIVQAVTTTVTPSF